MSSLHIGNKTFYVKDLMSSLGCSFWCLPADYGVDKYDIGSGFGHFAIATPDVSASLLVDLLSAF